MQQRLTCDKAILLLLGLHASSTCLLAADYGLLLQYDRPAANWNEALPLGNGRLGAMAFGGVEDDRLQINENTLWAGGPHDYSNPDAGKYVSEIRGLIFHRSPQQARELADRVMGSPKLQQAYQPFCDLRLHFDERGVVKDYRRQLDLDQAIASIAYRVGDTSFRREVFISHPDQVLVLRLTADNPGRISFDAVLDSPQPGVQVIAVRPDTLRLFGQLGARVLPRVAELDRTFSANWKGPGIKFEALLRVRIDGGRVSANSGKMEVRGANSATLLFSGATSFNNYHDIGGDAAARADRNLRAAVAKPFDRIYNDHVADYQRLFRRVQLDLGSTPGTNRPTNVRMQEFGRIPDPQLAVLFYQFGRYVLISSSRPGGQPPNLQGMWNQDLWPYWSSKYTTNINLQMNYWLAETGNLSECHEPLFDLIDDLRVTGATVAKAHYNAGGWVLHHNTDLWRGAAPVDGYWGVWPVGAAWLCQHLWDHYEFTGDEDFLRKRAYPAMKGAALFLLDFLVEAPAGVPFTGYLVTNPSTSPENGFQLPDGMRGSLTYAATMDIELIQDLFERCVKASEILGVDSGFRTRLDAARRRLPPLQIGRRGQLQEWIEDYEEQNPHHRHVAHLYALYPGYRITPENTPELADAARTTLELRGDEGQGWSVAWKMSLWARLKDANHAFRVFRLLVSTKTLPNMFSICPPMQVDGSFGATAGITEMLLQSHGGLIQLLPALPDTWPAGSVKGLRARGGIGVDMVWRDGKLTEVVLQSKFARTYRIRYRGRETGLQMNPGGMYTLDGNLEEHR